ncbi:MAG TPA: hypothetical protein VKB63_00525 [Gemmatimonadales bacterium]|nr:hypothetical protein [Gemmatimonadales bacterium]
MQLGLSRTSWLGWWRTALLARRALRRWRRTGVGDGDDTGRTAFYTALWRDAAAGLGEGARFRELDDAFWEIRYRGRCTRIARGMVMLDNPVTLALAGHKALVHRLLAATDLPVPPSHEFTLATLDEGEAFVREYGSPCVVKPARNSGAGEGVATHITRAELVRAALNASLYSRYVLIERQIPGDCYRLLYLHGRLLHAIRRHAPSVTGDGRSTIRQLITAENARRAQDRGASVTRLRIDLDMKTTLRHARLTLRSVPDAGEAVVVKTVVNDNARADNVAVTCEIGAALRDEGARAAATLGVSLAAIDVITPNPRVSLGEANGVIIEVNSTPGLHHHYNVRNPDGVDVAGPLLRCLLGLHD